MAENLKELRKRIQFNLSAQQMTKAMKLASIVKLKKINEAILQLRPYEKQLSNIFGNLSSQVNAGFKNPLTETRPLNKILIIVISADRGLCGGHHAQIFKLAEKLIRDDYPDQHRQGHLSVMPFGKKGTAFFKSKGYPLRDAPAIIPDVPSFDEIKSIASSIQDDFITRSYDQIDVVYSTLKNAIKYEYQSVPFLPVRLDQKENHSGNFIYDAPPDLMLSELLPAYLESIFFDVILRAKATEHAARMTAMDKATENARDLFGALKLSYNRVRQAAITKELTEIINGSIS